MSPITATSLNYIDQMPVVLRRPGHPDETTTMDRVYVIEGRLAVASLHGEGYWVYPDGPVERTSGGVPVAKWVPHTDARFWWTRN